MIDIEIREPARRAAHRKQSPPPGNGVASAINALAILAVAGLVVICMSVPREHVPYVIGGGSLGVMMLFAVASIVRSTAETAHNTARIAVELERIAAHNESPASAGTN